MLLVAASASAVALGIFWVLGAAALRISRVQIPTQEPVRDHVGAAELASVRAEIDSLRLRVDALPSLWEHERKVAEEAKEHADRQYRRAAQAKAAAERASSGESGESGELTDEQIEAILRENAARSGAEGLHSVPGDVGDRSQDDITQRAVEAGWSPYL